MLEKSKEIKFGKPGRSKAKKGTKKGRRRRQKGDTYLEKSKKGNMTPQELADYDKSLANAGDSRGYMGEDRNPNVVRYDDTDSTSTNRSNISARMQEVRATDKKSEENLKKLETAAADKELIDRRGESREKKQNAPQGSGGGAKSNVDKIGSSTEDDEFGTGAKKVKAKSATSKLLDKLSKQGTEGGKNQNKETKPAKKSNSYADAKKKDPKLDSYIKIRNNSKKGSPEYTAAQNKINAAYGKGPQRKVDIKPVKAQEAKPIERKSTPAKSIQTSSKTSSKPASKSASSSSNRNNTGGGSGMGGIQSGKDKLKNLGITTESDTKLPPSLSNREKRQNKREKKKEIRKDARNKIREIKGKPAKASYGRVKNQKGTSISSEYQENYKVNGERLKPPAGTTYNKYTDTSDAPLKKSQNRSESPKKGSVKASDGMSKRYQKGTMKYGKGGRKRAIVGMVAGAGMNAAKSLVGNIGSGKSFGDVAKEAAVSGVKGGLNSVVPGGGDAVAKMTGMDNTVATNTAATNTTTPAPTTGTTQVDPNATVQAQKGKMKNRRAERQAARESVRQAASSTVQAQKGSMKDRRKARQAARKYKRSVRRRNRNSGPGIKLGRTSTTNCIKGDC